MQNAVIDRARRLVRSLTLATAMLMLGNRGSACDVAERFRAAPEGWPVAPVLTPAAEIGSPVADTADGDAVTLAFTRHDIDPGPFGQVTEGINVGDLDSDGRPDIIEGGDEHLVWYHNPDWTPRPIADGFKFAGGAMVVVRDMDGDGRLDVLTGRYLKGRFDTRETVWYANTVDGWQDHILSRTAFCHDLAFADLDGDGGIDAACDDQFRGEIVWLARPADPTAEWESHLIDTRRAMGAEAADIDRDGAPDVVAGRAWYRREDDGSWTRHPFTTLEDSADSRFNDYAKVSVLDIDGDGRLDVFATLFADAREGQVYAFLAPPDPRDAWTAVQVDAGPLFGVHSQAPGSFDGSSRVQVMVGETNIGGFGFGPNPNPKVYVYRLLDAATDPAGWERTLVDTTGTHEARAVDVDGDGLADVVGDEENTDLITPQRNGRVSWWQNTTVLPASTTSTTTSTSTSLPESPGRPGPDGPEPRGTPGCRDVTCDDGDPCTEDTCDAEHGCAHADVSGPASVACVCARKPTATCTAGGLTDRIRRGLERACALVERAGAAPTAARARSLMRQAAGSLREARRVAAGGRRKRLLPIACADGLLATLDDASRRARGFKQGVGQKHRRHPTASAAPAPARIAGAAGVVRPPRS